MCGRVHRSGASLMALGVALSCAPLWAQETSDSKPVGEEERAPTSEDPNAMSSDEIFRRMFGQDPPPVTTNRFTVLIDGLNEGEALIDPGEDGWIESGFLEREVLPLLIPEAADAFRGILSTDRVSFSSLRSLSYDVSFDRRDLVLSLDVPFDLRGERVVLLGRRPNSTVVDALPQADFSAFVSARGGLDWIQKSPDGNGGLSGFVADIDAAINVRGVVLEGEFRFSEDGDRRFSRRDVRLTYDDVESLVRYEAGDLSIGSRPYQSAPDIAGFAAYREFRIDPYVDPRPVGERGLVLERAARVDVIVNGARARTVNLPAGRYSLRDFPIVPSAINDVEFVVTYASGEVERIVFPAFTTIDLLGQGTSEFAINVGVPFDDVEDVRRYDTDNFNLVGFYRRGLTGTLTAGASIEADKDILVVGGEASWASPVGSFGLTLSNNLRNPGLESGRLSLQYSYLSTDPFSGMSVDGLLILTGEEYRTLDRLFDGPASRVFASGRISKVIDDRTRIQLGGSYSLSSDRDALGSRTESWTASAALSRQIGPATVTGGVDWTTGGDRGSELIGRIGLFIPLGRHAASASYVSRDNTVRADFRRSARNAVGGFGYAAGFQRNDAGDQQYVRANYIGNRFEAAAEQLRVHSSGETDVRTGFSFGTALVTAGGKIALSRPVENGFVIVGNGTEVDSRIAIERRSSPLGGDAEYAAYTDFLGPGVVPDLPAYFVRRIEAEAPDAPVGAGLGGEMFVLKPGYRAGYAVEVGTAGGTVSALGNLVFADGSPAGMLSGSVRRLDGITDDGEVRTSETVGQGVFFTNAGGRFFMEGLDPGVRYEVLIDVDGDPQRFVLEAPEDAFGIWRMEQPIVIEGTGPSGQDGDGVVVTRDEEGTVTVDETDED